MWAITHSLRAAAHGVPRSPSGAQGSALADPGLSRSRRGSIPAGTDGAVKRSSDAIDEMFAVICGTLLLTAMWMIGQLKEYSTRQRRHEP